MYKPGQTNWVKAMQFKTIMHFHQTEYNKALKVAEKNAKLTTRKRQTVPILHKHCYTFDIH